VSGKVYIVGAGPGKFDLLTLRAIEVIEKADVILHDSLVGDEIVERLRSMGKELINVGKKKGSERRQEEINELMVKLAREGKTVVRLKGGDPFVFGRGYEEVRALKENGVDYEVVPGISSVTGVPSFYEIPLTRSGVSKSIVVIPGNFREEEIEDLVKNSTFVVLMARDYAENVTKILTKLGKSPDCPAAIIENGTLKNGRVIFCKIGELPEKMKSVKGVTMVVVGESINL